MFSMVYGGSNAGTVCGTVAVQSIVYLFGVFGMGEKTGLARAIDKWAEDAALDQAEDSENVQPLLPISEMFVEDGTVKRHSVGRKKGATNKSTREMIEFLRKTGRTDPLDALSLTYSRPVEVLAAELGITKEKAYSMQQAAAIASLPYWHARRAPENDKGEALPELSIFLGNGVDGERKNMFDFSVPVDEPKAIDITPENSELNQSLNKNEKAKLDE